MAHQFDAKKTQEYFNGLAADYSVETTTREDIFFKLILPKLRENKENIIALDFGCGGGALLLKMIEQGINTQGIEKHSNLCQLARQRLDQAGFDQAKVIQGGVEEIAQMPENSYDAVVLMGVFQYLSPEDYSRIFINIHKILKPNGRLVATFQNALFDLFTFNRYTIDFYQENFFKPLGLDRLFGDKLINDLKSLITNPDKPACSAATARDNIFVRTTNPLTIADELRKHRFNLLQKYFYSFFFMPRLIENKHKDQLEKLSEQFEIKRSTEWYGYFMANAFVVDCIKE